MVSMKRMSLRITKELHDKIVAIAKGEGRSIHGQIVYYLKRMTEGQKK